MKTNVRLDSYQRDDDNNSHIYILVVYRTVFTCMYYVCFETLIK